MTLRKKIIAGTIALAIGTSVALPTRARADSDDWHHSDHHAWQHHNNDSDDYHHPGYRYNPDAPAYAYRHRYVPPNGEGMINQRNPNFYWACDSNGHHCHWARR